MIFNLQPTNEGQDLNYHEQYDPNAESGRKLTLKESKTMAKDRAKQIIIGLDRLLPQGSFGCVIEELELYISPNLVEIPQ